MKNASQPSRIFVTLRWMRQRSSKFKKRLAVCCLICSYSTKELPLQVHSILSKPSIVEDFQFSAFRLLYLLLSSLSCHMTIEVPSFKLDGNDTLSTTYHPTDSSDFESSSESKPMKTIVPDDQNMAVIGALIGLIVVLSCLFLYLIFPQLVARFKRVMPASKKRVNARYETIEGWLITKVCGEDSILCA